MHNIGYLFGVEKISFEKNYMEEESSFCLQFHGTFIHIKVQHMCFALKDGLRVNPLRSSILLKRHPILKAQMQRLKCLTEQ